MSNPKTLPPVGIARIHFWRPSGAGYVEGPIEHLPKVKQELIAFGATITHTQILN